MVNLLGSCKARTQIQPLATPMKQELNDSHKVRRWGQLLLLGITACLMSNCAMMWYQIDPEYKALQSKVKSNWDEKVIGGVWVAQSSARLGLPAWRITIVIKPDHTAQQRQSGMNGGTATWTYNGRGTWTITPNNDGDVLDLAKGMFWLPMKVQYTGRYLLVDAPWNAGLYSAGGVVKNSHVFVRPDDKEAVERIMKKRFE